jgi:hypothetical protein
VAVEGVFYIAIEMDILQRANPARLDGDSKMSGLRSWLMYHDGPNLDDVGSSLFLVRMSEAPFVGAWMIRGEGTLACKADLSGDGVLNFLDVSAFLSVFGSEQVCGDYNQDGAFNFLDVSAFLLGFGLNCE